jgi:four helix bundle protein
MDNPVRAKSFAFALEVIELYRELRDRREYVLSRQLVRSGTSIGANVEEALAAQSRNDFLSKMSIASKEARETKYWLRLFRESRLADVDVTQALEDAEELIRMLTSIVKTTGEGRK